MLKFFESTNKQKNVSLDYQNHIFLIPTAIDNDDLPSQFVLFCLGAFCIVVYHYKPCQDQEIYHTQILDFFP